MDYGSANVYRFATTPPADFDDQGDVDLADLGIWDGAYGASDLGDADGDDDSDGHDFLLWQQQFTGNLVSSSAAGTNVPEPSALVLAIFASVYVLASTLR